MIYSQSDIQKLGRILGVWAHPDDESWASAGLMRMACLNGQAVAIVTATKGDAGQTADQQKWPQEKLAEIREHELQECLCHIGDVQQFWLDYEDGKMADADQEQAIDEVQAIIEQYQPDTILTFEHHGITGHDDHKTVHLWAHQASEKSGKNIRVLCAVESHEKFAEAGDKLHDEFNIFFNTDQPRLVHESDAEVCIKLPHDVLTCKLHCLKAHESQTAQMFASAEGKKALEIMAATECFVVD